jgi:hypothetical protein
MAYSSLTELIFTNRAKETAQTIRTFAERALAEAKRQNETATLRLDNNSIQYTIGANTVSTELSSGFSAENIAPNCVSGGIVSFNEGVQSKLMVGLSSLDPNEGYFAACDAKGYCGAAVKVDGKNSFVACIKRGKSTTWEVL